MLATVVAAVLAASPSPAPKPAPPPPPPVIEGIVRGPTNAPVKDAQVTVRLRETGLTERVDPPPTARTGDDGQFRIVLRKPARVDVRIDATGMAPKSLEARAPGKRLEVKLEKERTIEGVVRDA